MFTVYYSNQITHNKDLLIEILKQDPNPNPFSQEIVLVQSLGMAQWLQMQLAEKVGVVGNVQFLYPTNFLWQQYRLLFPELPKENIFDRQIIVWRLMRLLPNYLHLPEFSSLSHYLKEAEPLKQYQLAEKIAALFDQYLVYRPHWLVYWEENQLDKVLNEISNSVSFHSKNLPEIEINMQWQAILWNALVKEIKKETSEIVFNTSHRAYLQEHYFNKLDNLTLLEKEMLPKRIFIFGISSFPQTQLSVLKKLSEHCHIHLFFTNPSELYWANDRADKVLAKLALKQHISKDELATLFSEQGNPLLTNWGKQGKEFLNLLTEYELQSIDYFQPLAEKSLLHQIKNAILNSEYKSKLVLDSHDKSIQIHSCHSKMREIEVLHNQLLYLFEQHPELSPKDIIVMSADIDSYAPYINAVFSVYERTDPRFIPFTLSDQKVNYIEPIISSFLNLLSIKERKFTVEEIFSFFDIQAIREKYQLSDTQLGLLREWVELSGIRAGLNQQNPTWTNYNSWENGVNRLLLGISYKAENNPWQGMLAFNESYGLAAEIVGALAKFIENLTAWVAFVHTPHSLSDWKIKLIEIVDQFYQSNTEYSSTILTLYDVIETFSSRVEQANFNEEIDIEIISSVFEQQLSEQRNNLNFLVGKVNFCTLLPMRAIPFKVVCLLGMNEGEFPRQQVLNNFDLMQYAPQKGDRARRDDDRYLFLESLLSAQDIFYISYIGQSLKDSQPKLPSILVSQLIDYIDERLIDDKTLIINNHPMTVFSQNNFINGNAYDKEWLRAKNQCSQSDTFLIHLENNNELPDEIELSELINYIQSPLKWFFNKQLGVYLESYDQEIMESENFSLSALDKFNLLEGLLNIDLQHLSQFFENAKLKGELPACRFAEVSQEELYSSISALHQALSPYLMVQADIMEINLSLQSSQYSVKLVANIQNKYDDQIVQWRVGNLRDKDIIYCWLNYLVLKASNSQIARFQFYYRAGKDATYLSFKPISSDEAKNILICYIEDYLDSFKQLKWAITQEIGDYLKKSAAGKTSEIEQCQTTVQSSNDAYLKRILVQSEQFDYLDIHQRTLNWFEPMMQYIEKETK
ncbi:exodeoxyribonuclease V subunit gamma [Pasteurellaceae bacterium Orientalotternb1]|nr:exodeoxyribonuclease V subunit gamma [Pasteurellaceae bacterium Orientalotternb1]